MDIQKMIDMMRHRDKILPLGKFKGQYIEDVSTSYLLWYLATLEKKIEPCLKRNIIIYLIDNYKFEFGKHKDKTISEIMMESKGQQYLEWARDNIKNNNIPILIKAALN